MDNRLKFLYCGITELRGHGEEARAGSEKTGARREPVMEEKPHGKGSRLSGANKSSEARGGAVEKSRYCLYRTRTVNRHRWMRRES